MPAQNTFPKSKRLVSSKRLEEVYQEGVKEFVFPFKVYYSTQNTLRLDPAWQDGPTICVSVPKRKLKRAVDRNLIKRRSKEAYRLLLPQLLELNTIKVDIYMVYITDQYCTFEKIENSMMRIMKLIVSKAQSL